jgi:hypothetical protein
LSDNFLTPWGTVKYGEVFEYIKAIDFAITIVIKDKSYECTVHRNMTSSNNPMGEVVILKQPVRSSFFGTCTCGVDKHNSISFKHMAMLVVSSRISDIT